MKAYHIWIDDQIAPESFGEASVSAKFIRGEVMQAKKEGAEKLVLHMNTPGGHVFEGFAIFNELSRAGIPIEAYNEGVIASIGTLIMLAGADNTIYMSPASQLMFHKPMVGTQGNSDDHAASIAELKKIEDLMAERYAHKMGADISAGHDLMAHGEYWVNPNEAASLKIIDHIQMPIAAFGRKQEFINQKNNMKKTNVLMSLISEITAMISPPTAGMQKLADGSTILYFEGDTLETGKAVFTDESMTTKAPEGEHALEDGRIAIVDAAGVVVEIREVEVGAADQTAELATANARIAELEAELATAKAENQAQATAHQTQIGGVTAKLAKLQAMVVSAGSGVDGDVIQTQKKESAFMKQTRERVEAAKNGKLKI